MPQGRPSRHSRSTFGLRLFAARENAGLTQAQVAEKLGITQTAYALWERREMSLRPQQIEKLASILKVSPEYFFSKSVPRQRGGPTGKLRKVFEEVSSLPRYQQQRIIAVIEDMLLAHRTKSR